MLPAWPPPHLALPPTLGSCCARNAGAGLPGRRGRLWATQQAIAPDGNSLEPSWTRWRACMQSIYEDVARDTNRGHTVEAVKECFVLAKDAGFKV